MSSLNTTLAVLAQCSLLLVGCGSPDTATSRRDISSQSTLDLVAPPGVSVSHDLHLGKAIFTGKCLACHGSEKSGAPQLGSVDDWELRLQQPLNTLIQHAIHGYGRMPAKGGLSHVSDNDVAAAVAYAVSRSDRLIAAQHRQQQALACQDGACDDKQASNEALRLHMLLMLRNPDAR